MCGIAGMFSESEAAVRAALPAMTACMTHRGPDAGGQVILPFGPKFLGLGHRRLAIIDLSAAGSQPMVNPATGDQLIFNGEIYNFQSLRNELERDGIPFRGHSDTEVMLHALSRWGPDALPKFEGMYAFAFYNAREQSLMLARDPMGIKPLYVARLNGTLLFASEVRSILATNLVPRTLDRSALAGLLAFACVQRPATIVEKIRAFRAGSFQIFHSSGNGAACEPKVFWQFPAPDASIAEADAVPRVEKTLDDAVRDHLVADVPVGVFLSSGLDSTIIAALAARHHPRIRSFTVGFADQPQMSETPMATRTAELFGLDHTNIEINGPDAEAACHEWFDALDQPSIDGLNVFIISKAVRAHGITVALSGQGGDELFGGYPAFADVPKMRRMLQRVMFMPASARMALASVLAIGRSSAQRQKLIDMFGTNGSLLELYLQRRRAVSNSQLAALGLRHNRLKLNGNYVPPESLEYLTMLDADPVWTISELECRFYQQNMLLRDSDVNGMAHSLEIRVPLLDQRVVNLASRIPGPVRLPNGSADKHLLRVAFAPYLRSELLTQRKRGFTLPIAHWMTGPLRHLCEHALLSLKNINALEPAGIDAIWRTFLSEPDTPIWTRAFTLCVLGMYIKKTGLS